jgi:tetratricopeptide (TPR) repeat protein
MRLASRGKPVRKDLFTSEINELKKKLEENPDSPVFVPLADAYRKQGNLQEALNVCKKGLEKNPANTNARVVLGRVYKEQGKIEDAAAELKKVLEVDPENLMAHSSLGAIYMEKNDYQAAIEEYQEILTLNPDDEETQTSLKKAIERAAGEQKAAKSPKKEPGVGIEKKPPVKESTATLTIAELYLKQGHFDKAIEIYQELLADDPQNLMFRQKLAEAVDRQHQEPAAGMAATKLKKNEFVKPPDQKEDVIVDEVRSDGKKRDAGKREEDSKFTNDDILQVMRRGGKDDVVVEEKPSSVSLKRQEANPAPAIKAPEKIGKVVRLQNAQVDELKGVLAELGGVSGIIGCFVIGEDGITVVSMGETSNNADPGKQALAIFDSTHRSMAQMNQGKLQQVLVTAETGHILLVSFKSFVLVVLASSKINLGLLRLALDSAIKKLDKIL